VTTDPYLWPDADCLKNKLGITDPELLAEFEGRIVSSRDVELARDTLPGEYNLQHFQRFHWALFRDVYDWSGQTRTVDITKDGLPFGRVNSSMSRSPRSWTGSLRTSG
jgi:cell filamentation protein